MVLCIKIYHIKMIINLSVIRLSGLLLSFARFEGECVSLMH